MVELHDALGGEPAVWVGHDWGSPVVWSLAAHHAGRCAAVVSLVVPYLRKGFALANLTSLVDREVYPVERFPDGQWSYWRFYYVDFERAVADFDADVEATAKLLCRRGRATAAGEPARSAGVVANGGWFGAARRAPDLPRDESMLSAGDFATVVGGLRNNGFRGPCSWYVNDAANIEYAAQAPDDGRLAMPVLFVHGTLDTVCETVRSPLAEPMRADCADLTEAVLEAGHEVMLERPAEVSAAIEGWLSSRIGTA